MTVSVQNPINYQVGNGSVTSFSFNFQLLDEDDLRVFVSGVPKTNGADFTITGVGNSSGGTVVFGTAPGAVGAPVVVMLQRKVALNREADYQEAAALPTETLNRDIDRVVQMVQDTAAAAAMTLDGFGQLDATGKRITNVGDPVNAQDVVTKVWAETSGTAQVAQATAQAVIATTRAGEAAVSAAAALVSENNANTSKLAAGVLATNAAASEATATASKNQAVTSAGGASTSAAAALVSETNANTSKLAAGVSETNAAGSATAANASKVAAGISETNAAGSATAAAASAASIAGGPVASIAGLTGAVTSAAAKTAMALNLVDNTADASKPVSTAQAASIATKYPLSSNPSFRNLLINGDGRIVYADTILSGSSNAAGAYFTNRWKSSATGVVSWSTGASGKRTFLVAAAGVEQVVEGARYNHGGVHTLSWVGTATATVNGTAIANGGQTVALTAGANITVKFASGTFTDAQLERGSVPTAFENRDLGVEDMLCQRYAPCFLGGSGVDDLFQGFAYTATACYVIAFFRVPARVTPTSVFSTGGASQTTYASNGTVTGVALSSGGTYSCRLICTASGASYTPGHGAFLYATSTSTKFLFLGCEL